MIDAVIMAGIIILITGLYYLMVKAGIPYQNPPLDLRIKYTVNMSIGETLSGIGFKTMLCGIIIRLVSKLMRKKVLK